jgi:membrane-associated phospholipid phosphatase
MGWRVDVDSEAGEQGTRFSRQMVMLDGGAGPLVQRAMVSGIYPDHWFGDEWWKQVKAAGRYAHVISAIKLQDPPDAQATRQEAADVFALRAAPDYQNRLVEIIEENEGPPAYYHRMLFADQGRNIQTGALIMKVISWSLPPIMYFKHKWKRARPAQIDPRIRPVLDCPTHAAYPSGHSTQSHLIALVVGRITGRKDIEDALWEAAHRIAQNREYAGIHYKSDSECGIDLATQLLPFFVAEHEGLINKAHAEEWG